jgi:hypothetical protein
MKTSTTNVKKSRTSKKSKIPYNYREITLSGIQFRSASLAARFLLKRTKKSQSEIARCCGVSQPCVCQLAAEIKLAAEQKLAAKVK